MNLHQLYLTENDCYKANRWITPKGVMVHRHRGGKPEPETLCRPGRRPFGREPE